MYIILSYSFMYECISLIDQPVNLTFALVLKTAEVTCVGRAATPVDLVEDASLTLIDPDAATVPLEIRTPTNPGDVCHRTGLQ